MTIYEWSERESRRRERGLTIDDKRFIPPVPPRAARIVGKLHLPSLSVSPRRVVRPEAVTILGVRPSFELAGQRYHDMRGLTNYGPVMGYTVCHFIREQETRVVATTFQAAKAIAEIAVASGAFDRTEVIDGERNVVFRRPTKLRQT